MLADTLLANAVWQTLSCVAMVTWEAKCVMVMAAAVPKADGSSYIN